MTSVHKGVFLFAAVHLTLHNPTLLYSCHGDAHTSVTAGENGPSQEAEASRTIRWEEGAAPSPCFHLQHQPSHQTLPVPALHVLLLNIDSYAARLVDCARRLVKSVIRLRWRDSDRAF